MDSPEGDEVMWMLIERLLSKYKGDKDVEAVCFLLAGAMGTVRRLEGSPSRDRLHG